MVSEAQKKATTKYEAANYDKICLRLKRSGEVTREAIQKAADQAGMSLNSYILEAIKEKISK